MTDGTIRVGTKLDTSGIKADLKELKRELASVQKESDKLAAQEEKIRSAFANERETDSQFPEEFQHKNDIDKREAAALEQIKAQQEELNAKKREYSSLIDQANAKLQEQTAIAQANQQLDAAMKTEAFTSKITTQEQYNSLLEQTRAKMEAIEAAAQRVAEANGVSASQLLAANPAYQRLADQMGILTDRTWEFEDATAQAGATAETSMRTAETATSGFGTALTGAIKTVAKMALTILGIRTAYSAVRMAVSQYMTTNDQLAAQVDSLKSLFAYTLGPAIEYVVNLLVQAVSAVNAFIYALTGVNVVAKANTAALENQAAASTGAATAAAEAAEALSPAGFDEQNKLTDTSSGGGGDGGSGSGGGGGGYTTLPDGTELDMSFLDPLMEAIKKFKDDITPLLTTLKELGKWVLDNVLIPFADWAVNSVIPGFLDILGAAALVLNDALLILQPIALWFWEEVLEPIASWTGGIIVDVLQAIADWIGEHQETLANIAAVVLEVVAAVTAVNTAIDVLGGLLAVLSSPVALAVEAVTGLVVLFVELYDSCEEFRAGVDQAWEGIKEIFQGAVDFIRGLFTGDEDLMAAGWEKIKEGGQNLFEGLWEGLQAGWDWIKEKLSGLWEKVSTAFCEFFGIHSPSTLFATYGENMMDGLINGVKKIITDVIDVFKDLWKKIKDVFSSVKDWFKEKFSNGVSAIASAFTNAVSKVKKAAKKVWSAVTGVFSNATKWIKDKFTTAVGKITSSFTNVVSKVRSACKNVWNAIKDVFSGVTSWFRDKFSAAWTAVKNVFSKGGKIFSGIKDGIASTFKSIVNGLISGINKIIATPFNTINGLLNKIRSISVLGKKPFSGLWDRNPLSVPQIPKLARGGIVNRPGGGVPAIIGEAGAEAVLPLENNTGWMDILAEKINGSGTITIPIYMDGKRIYQYVVDIGKRKAFAANGG